MINEKSKLETKKFYEKIVATIWKKQKNKYEHK